MSDRVKYILILVVVTLLLGAAAFKLTSAGKLYWQPNSSPQIQTQIQNNQTRVVVSEETAVIQAVEKTSPSVVAIGVNQRLINPYSPFAAPANQPSTIGTGFIVSDKGVIVTNRHVVSDTSLKYSVVTKDGQKLEIEKIYRDPNLDLALVKVSNSTLKSIELGDSSKLKVGQTTIAIGNALGRYDNTVTTGVVSGLGRAVSAGDPFSGQTERLDNLIQTDAAINPGNSGGPLLNSSGQAIGVNVATTEGAQNIGFAIPINSVKAILTEFVQTGTVQRAFLGVRYSFISKDVAILNEVPQGAYVQNVVDDSPAAKGGIQPRDIITKIDGQPVDSETKIAEVIQSKKVGQSLTLDVWSNGKTKTVTVTLSQAPE